MKKALIIIAIIGILAGAVLLNRDDHSEEDYMEATWQMIYREEFHEAQEYLSKSIRNAGTTRDHQVDFDFIRACDFYTKGEYLSAGDCLKGVYRAYFADDKEKDEFYLAWQKKINTEYKKCKQEIEEEKKKKAAQEVARKKKKEEAEQNKEPVAPVPYVGMLESQIENTELGKPAKVEKSSMFDQTEPTRRYKTYTWNENGKWIFKCTVIYADKNKKEVPGYVSAAWRPYGYSKKSDSAKTDDSDLSVSDYRDPDDFYYDHYDDFYDFEEAEEYYYDHGGF